jgi:hypothetical protein
MLLRSRCSGVMQVYEDHLPDSFAAMLDMGRRESGPVIYFYCLSNPAAATLSDSGYNAFAAAHHVVLDTSIPFSVVEIKAAQAAAHLMGRCRSRYTCTLRSSTPRSPSESSARTW